MQRPGYYQIPISQVRQLVSGLSTQLRAEHQAVLQQANKLKEEGNKLYQEGRLDDAINHYTQAIDAMDKLPTAAAVDPLSTFINNRAAVLLQSGKYLDCVIDCTIVLGMQANNVKAFTRRALAYEYLEKKGEAQADYQAAIAIERTNVDALAGLERIKGDQAPPPLPTISPAPAPAAPAPAPAEVPAEEKAAPAAAEAHARGEEEEDEEDEEGDDEPREGEEDEYDEEEYDEDEDEY
eukprot:tig00000383_g24719.t1